MTGEIDYCLVIPQEFKTHYMNTPFEISGLLNWVKVFGGDIKTIDEDLSGYEYIHCNISSTELEYLPVIKMLNPDAKIIVNMDYSIDILQQYFITMERVKDIINMADFVFSVDDAQRSWLSMMLKKPKEIHLIPHPVDISAVKKFKKPFKDREDQVAVMWHQYDNNQILPLEVLKNFPDLKSILFGVKVRHCIEKNIKFVTAHLPIDGRTGSVPEELKKLCVFSPIGWFGLVPYLNPSDYYNLLSQFKYALDLYQITVAGRMQMDAAMLGIPCVSSNLPFSARRLFPDISFPLSSPGHFVDALKKLKNSKQFYDSVVREAEKGVQYYNFENSRRRFLKMLGVKR